MADDLRARLTRHEKLTRGWQQVQSAADARASAEPGSRTYEAHNDALDRARSLIDEQAAPSVSRAISDHLEVHELHRKAMSDGSPEDYVNRARRAKAESISVVGRLIKKEQPTLTHEALSQVPVTPPAAPAKATKKKRAKPKPKASPYAYIKTSPGAVKAPLGEEAFDTKGKSLGNWERGQKLSSPVGGKPKMPRNAGKFDAPEGEALEATQKRIADQKARKEAVRNASPFANLRGGQ